MDFNNRQTAWKLTIKRLNFKISPSPVTSPKKEDKTMLATSRDDISVSSLLVHSRIHSLLVHSTVVNRVRRQNNHKVYSKLRYFRSETRAMKMTDFSLRTAFSIPRYFATQCIKVRFRYIPYWNEPFFNRFSRCAEGFFSSFFFWWRKT